MNTQMAADDLRMVCLRKVRQAAAWILQRTEIDDGLAEEAAPETVIEFTEELDLDQRFDTYLDLTMEEDPSRAWFTA